jgi:hypothetical protein
MITQLPKLKQQQSRQHKSGGGIGPSRTADIIINGGVRIPGWVTDHDSFRQWAFSEAYPKGARFAWLVGNLWIEVNSELLEQLIDPELQCTRTNCVNASRKSIGVLIDELIFVPRWVQNLGTFCQWAESDSYPEYGQLSFIDNTIWVDLR